MNYPRPTSNRVLTIVLTVCLSASALFATEPFLKSSKSLKWRSSEIKVSISRSLSDQSPNIKGDISEAITNSLDSWRRVSPISFVVSDSESLNVSLSGLRGDGVSLITNAATAENVRLFPKQTESPPATTRIFYDQRGFITEADLALNPFVQFSTDGTFGTYDLQSTITHEIGHLLGLEHSTLLGSSMFERAGRNGSTGFAGRGLSRDDIAAVRSIYGTTLDDLTCCGSISGKIGGSNPKLSYAADVWIEDAVSGQVVASKRTSRDGVFNILGVPEGNYRVFAQSLDTNKGFAVQIAKVRTEIDEDTPVQGSLKTQSAPNIELLGLNGQLSNLPIQLVAGQTTRIYVGGKGLNAGDLVVGIQGPFFESVRGSQIAMDYGIGLNVLSAEIQVSPDTPSGEYSIYVADGKGSRRYLIGAVTLD